MTKSFVVLMVIFVVIGASIGGAFAGGVAVGKKQQDEAPTGPFAALGDVPNFAAASQQAAPSQLPQGVPANVADSPALGQGGPGGLFPGAGGGMFGIIEDITDNVVTVNSPQGPLQIVVNEDTEIQTFAEGSIEDLEMGMLVTIEGEINAETGSFDSTSIVALPGDAGAQLGGGGGFRRGGAGAGGRQP